MREIKFRSWNPKMNRMSYNRDCFRAGFQYSERLNSFAVLNMVNTEDVDEELMQYTGLKDKNGKEIYEWDLCKTTGTNLIGKIIFIRGSFCFEYINCKFDGIVHIGNAPEIYEIVGNIYENPELVSISSYLK